MSLGKFAADKGLALCVPPALAHRIVTHTPLHPPPPLRFEQGKHVKFAAGGNDGHGTIKRKPTAFIRRQPAEEEEEEEQVLIPLCCVRHTCFPHYSNLLFETSDIAFCVVTPPLNPACTGV